MKSTISNSSRSEKNQSNTNDDVEAITSSTKADASGNTNRKRLYSCESMSDVSEKLTEDSSDKNRSQAVGMKTMEANDPTRSEFIRPLKILFIECGLQEKVASELLQNSTTSLFHSSGILCSFFVIGNTFQALEMAESIKFDLIFCNVELQSSSGPNGRQFISILRNLRLDIPIIEITEIQEPCSGDPLLQTPIWSFAERKLLHLIPRGGTGPSIALPLTDDSICTAILYGLKEWSAGVKEDA